MAELSESARAMRNQYMSNWRKNNPDKRKEYEVNYWERKANTIPIEERAKAMHRNGHTQREIAKDLGVSLGTVNKYLDHA